MGGARSRRPVAHARCASQLPLPTTNTRPHHHHHKHPPTPTSISCRPDFPSPNTTSHTSHRITHITLSGAPHVHHNKGGRAAAAAAAEPQGAGGEVRRAAAPPKQLWRVRCPCVSHTITTGSTALCPAASTHTGHWGVDCTGRYGGLTVQADAGTYVSCSSRTGQDRTGQEAKEACVHARNKHAAAAVAALPLSCTAADRHRHCCCCCCCYSCGFGSEGVVLQQLSREHVPGLRVQQLCLALCSASAHQEASSSTG